MTNRLQPLQVRPDDRAGTGRADLSSVRASDSEREAAALSLRDHCAAGRLSPDELSDRLELAYAAKTSGALTALFEDLPVAGSGKVGRRPRPVLRPSRRLIAIPAVTGVLALAASTEPHLLWMAWPALAVAGGRHHRFYRRLDSSPS